MSAVAIEPLLSRKEVSALLRVSVQTLAHWAVTRPNKLPMIRVGGKVGYEPSEVRRFIDENRVGAGEDS